MGETSNFLVYWQCRMRIVSLIASATEMVAALGKAGDLVGISHECDWPKEAVEGRSVVTSPKMDVRKSTLEIHNDVQEILSKGLSVYNIDVEKLKELRPDIIITQDQCEVCAVTYEDVLKATKGCLGENIKVVNLHPDSLGDIFEDILKVGEALGVRDRAEKLLGEIRVKMANIAKKIGDVHGDAPQKRGTSPRPRVICLDWTSPFMAAGYWMPELVEMAGGINGITQKGEHTKIVSLEEIKAFNPDMTVVMPCGYTIAQTLENRADLKGLPGKIHIVDGNTYMNRPGPRILESLYILAGLFHPDLFKGKIPEGACIPLGT